MPWQKDLMEKMYKYKGRRLLQITGRNSGKSQMSAAAMQRLMEDIWTRPIEDLLLSDGTVYGSRYYTVEPVGGNWRAMELWCFETFGDSGDNSKIWGEKKAPEPAHRWYMNNRKFWFRNEKDRLMFIMKWR